VWPRPPFFRRQRDQARLSNSAGAAVAEFSPKLERGTDPLPVVRYDRKAGQRSLDLLRWGLITYWAKDIKVGFEHQREGRRNRKEAGFP